MDKNLERYFKILDLEPSATPEQIKQAYKDLVQILHPDRYTHNARLQKKVEEKLKQVNEAYEKLKDYTPDHSYQPFKELPETEGGQVSKDNKDNDGVYHNSFYYEDKARKSAEQCTIDQLFEIAFSSDFDKKQERYYRKLYKDFHKYDKFYTPTTIRPYWKDKEEQILKEHLIDMFILHYQIKKNKKKTFSLTDLIKKFF